MNYSIALWKSLSGQSANESIGDGQRQPKYISDQSWMEWRARNKSYATSSHIFHINRSHKVYGT